jgi:hypothetical protein
LFAESDAAGAAPVAIVGQTFADSMWPGDNPIGHRIRVAGGEGNPMRAIVGVVGDVRHYGFHLPATPQVYIPHAQTFYPEPMTMVVIRMREGHEPLSMANAVRGEIRWLDPLQPVTRLQTYEAIARQSLATRRFTLLLLAIFAGTALTLAIVGLYGALSYVVGQRRREIGVRVALGAAARDILHLVVRQGMQPVVTGVIAGAAVSLAAGRAVEGLLFGVTPRDGVTFAVVLVGSVGCGLIACLVPARRAARIAPSTTLRAQ